MHPEPSDRHVSPNPKSVWIELPPSSGAGYSPASWRRWGRAGIALGTAGLLYVVAGTWFGWPGFPDLAARSVPLVLTVWSAWAVQDGWRFVRNANGRDCPWCGHPKLAALVKSYSASLGTYQQLLDRAYRCLYRYEQLLAACQESETAAAPDSKDGAA
jgi:hypothetical protein